MKMHKRFLAVMMLLALFLSGCGGTDESAADSTPTLSPEEEEVLALIHGDNYDPDAVAEPSPTPPSDKKAITIGVCGGYRIDELFIYDLNESDLDYRVEIIDYGEMFDYDLERGMQQFNIDVATGKGPDIFDLSSLSFNLDNYARKGILEDLNPWLEADEELDRDDFIESVFSLCEVDGGLYAILDGFTVKTLYCGKSTAESLSGWSLKDFYPYSNSVGDAQIGSEEITTIDGETFLSTLCVTTLVTFMDFSTGEAYFDSEEFIELLECCKDMESRELDEQPKLRYNSEMNFFDIEYEEFVMGEELVYLGFPGLGDGDAVSYVNNQTDYFAMNAFSENKEEAWDFMRRFLLPEYQNKAYAGERNRTNAFPTNKESLNALIEKSQSPVYVKDENGQEYELKARGWYGDFEYSLASDEHIEKILGLIDSVNGMQSFDYTVTDIVMSEAGAYFAGDKTAEETAALIQSRVKLYLGEQMS